MKRVALYLRVSTEEQKLHGLSIESQQDALTKWANDNQYTIVGYYNDAGISARKAASKRPALQSLLEDVQQGRVDVIAFTKLDRWFRNIAEYYKAQEVLDKKGVAWTAIHEDYETLTASGRLKVNIMLAVAQDEADRTSERIKAVLESKRQRREPTTGHVPMGYRIDGKAVVYDESKYQLIKDFFAWYMETNMIGDTCQRIKEKYGIILRYRHASQILSNKSYYGEIHGIQGYCPPYITRSEFDKIQSMRRVITRRPKEDRTYLFTTKCVCGECGKNMRAKTHISKVKKYRNIDYTCPEHTEDKLCANTKCHNEKNIEQYLIDHIEQAVKNTISSYYKSEGEITKDKQKLADDIKKRIERLNDLYLNEFITIQELKEKRSSYQHELDSLHSTDSKEESIKKLEEFLAADFISFYAEASREEKRIFWQSIIKKIRIYADRHIEFDIV